VCQISSFVAYEMKHQDHFEKCKPMERPGNLVKEHLILGTDKQDAEEHRDLWLSQNPAVKVVRIHPVKREPRTLLTRIGGKHVPQVSIMVEYEQPDVRAQRHLRTAAPSKERHCEKYADSGGDRNPVANLFADATDFNVKEMAQGGGHHRCDEESK
jgi:hypothetical protein